MKDSSIEQQGVGAGVPGVRLAPQFAVGSPRASHMALPSHYCGGNSWWPRAVRPFPEHYSVVYRIPEPILRPFWPIPPDFDPTILAAPAGPADHGKPKGRAPWPNRWPFWRPPPAGSP